MSVTQSLASRSARACAWCRRAPASQLNVPRSAGVPRRYACTDAFGTLTAGADKQDAAKQAILARVNELAAPAVANLQRLAALY